LLKDYKDTTLNSPKVVIASVPFVDETVPLAAPAVLKSALQSNGIDCVGLDLNIEIYNKIQHRQDKHLFLDFFYHQIIHEEIVDELVRMLDFYATEILYHRPAIVGLSLFAFTSQTFTAWLCAVLRQRAPDIKIVIGGPGLETLENSLFKFPDRVKKLGLIDDYITGDAETALVEYVRGNLSYPGINSYSWKPNADFNKLPIPDYSDYRLLRYDYAALPIVDSRGCVQSCEFCDVIAFWEKFQYLSAENIFKQMQTHIKNHGVYRFYFASSICNGNMKEFKKLLKLMSTHNEKSNAQSHIHWIGSFIVRPAVQHKEELWKMIKSSNGFLLTGVESIVEHVRINLGKKFNNADLEHHLQMARKYQIQMNLLMILCYPTETVEDYQQVRQWFIDHKEFANETVLTVQCTMTDILPGTKLEKTIDHTAFANSKPMKYQHAIDTIEVIKQCGFNVQTFFSL
jgi:radical SAM superfamily enzyme YgiQ (UPF0313 family)